LPLLDLSQVTEVLIRLLERYLLRLDSEVTSALSITGDPPDVLEKQSEPALSLYLYHVREDEYHKNLPEPPGSNPPVRYREMGLNLFYLLTAYGGTHSGGTRYDRPYNREQRLIGLAIKAFHDYPALNASTTIETTGASWGNDHTVFPLSLRDEDDELMLTLHPATMEEINKVWTAVAVPMRLSAIYQVSVVFLKAEKPSSRTVPVLLPQVGVGDFQPLWIEGTESDHTFTIPGERKSRTVAYSPALVAVGEVLRIRGHGFVPGRCRVLLSGQAWEGQPPVDITEHLVREHSSESRIELTLPSEVTSPSEASGRTIAIVPGLYQVSVQCGRAPPTFSPLAVAPSIAPQDLTIPGIDPPAGLAGSEFTITGRPFSGPGIYSLTVYMGTHECQFTVPADSTSTIKVVVPANLGAGTYALRVEVNGISTLPTRWFKVIP